MGVLIEKYIGKTGRKLFLLFSWLFTLLVIAAFTDMVAGTFNGFTVTGAKSSPNAAITSKVNNKKTEGIIFFLFYRCIFQSGHPWIFLHSLQKHKEM